MDINEATDRILMVEPSRVSVCELATSDLLWIGDVDNGGIASAAFPGDGTLIAACRAKGEVRFHQLE